MRRLLGLALALALLVLLPFLLLGGRLEAVLGGEAALAWLAARQGWAPLAGVLLLLSDLVLPIPATAVMTALGILYGPFLGGLLSAAGSFGAGALGYLACRALGRHAARAILGRDGLERGGRWLRSAGGPLVALSRALPVLPEVMVCMAGLAGMPPARFFMALACGALPTGFAFAGLGAVWRDRPLLPLAVSLLLPLGLWLLLRPRLAPSGAADPALAQKGEREA